MEPEGIHEIEQAVGLSRNSYCGLVSLTFFMRRGMMLPRA